MPITEPAALLKAYASQRSEAAFRTLVDHYLPLVHAAAMRHAGGNATLAQDIAQEVFIALGAKAGTLSNRPTLAPWLFTTTRLATLNRLRSEQRRREREQEAYIMEQIGHERVKIDWDQMRPLIDSLLTRLGPRDQEAIFMRFFEGRTFVEIGARLNIGEDSARQRSNRAVGKLRSLLSKRGVRSTSVVLAEVLTTQFAGATSAELASTVTSTALAASTAVPGGAAAAAIIFSSMNASKVSLFTLAFVAFGGIGGTLYNAQRSQRAEALTESLEREHAAMRAAARKLADELQVERSRGATTATEAMHPLSAAGAAANTQMVHISSAASTAPANAARPSSVAALLDQIDHVLAHPELRPAFIQQIVQQLWGEDRRFFKVAGVSSQQEEAIKREAEAYANTLLQARAGRIGGEDFNDLFAAADEHSFAQVKRILGEDTFTRLKDYKAQSGENRAVDQLATQLYFTDTPLTGAQAAQIAEILVQNRFSIDQASRQLVSGRVVSRADHTVFQSTQPGPRIALITDAAIARAQGTLPAATVAALQNLQASQSAQMQLTRPRSPTK